MWAEGSFIWGGVKLVRVELECSKGTVRGIGMLYQRGNREWMGASEEGQIKGRVWNSWEVGVTLRVKM